MKYQVKYVMNMLLTRRDLKTGVVENMKKMNKKKRKKIKF